MPAGGHHRRVRMQPALLLLASPTNAENAEEYAAARPYSPRRRLPSKTMKPRSMLKSYRAWTAVWRAGACGLIGALISVLVAWGAYNGYDGAGPLSNFTPRYLKSSMHYAPAAVEAGDRAWFVVRSERTLAGTVCLDTVPKQ